MGLGKIARMFGLIITWVMVTAVTVTELVPFLLDSGETALYYVGLVFGLAIVPFTMLMWGLIIRSFK